MTTILISVRKQSERCPEKCTRPFFEDLSLTELTLKKFANREDVILAAHEEEFREMAEHYGVRFLQRTLRSALGETAEEVWDYLPGLDAETICVANVCTPFVKVETIDAAIKTFSESDAETLIPVIATYEIVLDTNKVPLNKDSYVYNSKFRDPLYTLANCFLIYTKKNALELGFYFKKYLPGDPMFHEISYRESLDIDTEEQFQIVQAAYNVYSQKDS